MHGLNKVQDIYWDALALKELTNTNQYANTFEYHLADPVTLNTLGIINNGDNVEVFMKRINFWVRWYNFGSMPVYIQTTKLVQRKDIAATVSGTPLSIMSIMQEDAPLIHNPFISPTTGNAFQKQCKIIKMKTTLIPPGKSYICKMKRRVRRSVPWTGRVQGNSSQYSVLKGEQTVVFRVWGYPCYSSENEDFTELAHYRLQPLVYRYASWYRMDDVIPSSTTIQLLTGVGGTQQLKSYSNQLQQYDVPTPLLNFGVSVPQGTTEFPVKTNTT